MGTDDELPTTEPESDSKPVSQSTMQQASGSSFLSGADSSGLPGDHVKPATTASTLTSEFEWK